MVEKIIQDLFGFEVLKLKKLDGYDNANYHVTSNSGEYIFKTYRYDKELFSILEAEIDSLNFLQTGDQEKFPRPIPLVNGEMLTIIDLNGEKTICRMLTFLSGNFIGDEKASIPLYRSLGEFLAKLSIKLKQFDSFVYRARKWEWDIQYLFLNEKFIDDIKTPHERNIVRYFFQQFKLNVLDIIPELRKQIIHNDANEWNILVQNECVSGIIDFGDLAYAPLINELAVALTYACYDKENYLEWAAEILKSYHALVPLEEKELSILYYLIAARLCVSVCNSAHAKKANSDNSYATSSEESAWRMIHNWLKIGPIKAENSFREAVGFSKKSMKSTKESVDQRYKYLSPILSLSYQQPIQMERSAFQFMYDAHGNTFLDAYNNIPHVGHSHPKVAAAGQNQMGTLNTNTRYLYDLLPRYAEKLLSKFPDSLCKVYFVNSGSAASDLAIRMAHAHTNNKNIMVMEHGYHGNTKLSMEISDYKFSNKKGIGQQNTILKTPIPDTYRGKYRAADENASAKYASDAMSQLENFEQGVGAFISEPIVGCAGQVPLAKGYLKNLYPAVRQQGGICISDEVQTGFGRLGEVYWGFEAHDVIPDVVILGKPIGNGHPIGAVVTTQAISDSFSQGVEFFSSFGGNPVSCAIGLSVLEVIEEEQLQQNAKQVGDYYKEQLFELQKKFSCIGDVRGSGLFLGVEIIKNEDLEPDTRLASKIKNELRRRNILISTDGPFDSVLKSKPPLCFTKENAKFVVDQIEDVLHMHFSEG